MNKKGKLWGNLKQKLVQHFYLTRFIGLAAILVLLFCLICYLMPCFYKFLINKPLSLVGGSVENLKATAGRINVLLLGVGGKNHEGADLTDTIIFFSLDQQGKDVLMLSLPRDIWVPSMRAKINTAYHYGEEKMPGNGLVLAKASVSEILKQPIHYSLIIDFNGFIKAINLLGGVEVEVERAFDDYKYPIAGKENAEPESDRYEHIHFETGLQQMDGERALKYVRSRYAEGEEGTDFARSRRQQQLILAVRNKIFSSQTFLNPQRFPELVQVFQDSIKFDILQEEYLSFLDLALKLEKNNLRSYVLNGYQDEAGLLMNPPSSDKYDNQWVLVPRSGSWESIHRHVQALIDNNF